MILSRSFQGYIDRVVKNGTRSCVVCRELRQKKDTAKCSYKSESFTTSAAISRACTRALASSARYCLEYDDIRM